MKAGAGICRKKDERTGENEKQLWPFSLFTLGPPLLLRTALKCFSNPSNHISGQRKMSLFLFLRLMGEITIYHTYGIFFSLHSRNGKTNHLFISIYLDSM